MKGGGESPSASGVLQLVGVLGQGLCAEVAAQPFVAKASELVVVADGYIGLFRLDSEQPTV